MIGHTSIITGLLLTQNAAAVLARNAVHGHRRAHDHQPGRHNHHQHHRRDSISATEVVHSPTVIVYEFENRIVAVDEVCEGIKNGTFVWITNDEDAPDCRRWGLDLSSATSVNQQSPSSAPSSVVPKAMASAAIAGAQQSSQAISSTSQSPVSSTPAAAAAAAAGSAQVIDTSGLTGYDAKIAVNPNVTMEFPDGVLDCSVFPSAYGAIPVDWVGLGGWSGIQYTAVTNNIVTHIDTAVAGNGCMNPGGGNVAFCSYACPAGYQKSQWPSTQGSASMAVSVGGLMCGADGKLHLTNPGLSKHLCIPGTNQVFVENRLSASNAICRTDYPGTESETVPLVVQKTRTSPLACPDASTYYKHLGMPTTAEYYVNMKGISVDQACVWATDGSYRGNWAPVVFGVGMDQYGKTWLSIQSTIQNNPSSYKDLDFSVELQGNFGGARCFYTNGHYCSQGSPDNYDASKCQTISSTVVPGCTVELLSGNATYVLTN